MTLHARCLAELEGWTPTDDLQGGLQRTFCDHLAEHPNGWSRECPGAHLTASSIILSDDGDRVLLVLHRRVGRWLQTGGHLEPGDASLADAALREAREESGLSWLSPVGGIVQLDRHEVQCGVARPAFHLDVRYAFTADPAQSPVVSDESDDVRWFSLDALPDVDASVTTLVEAARERLRA